MHPNLQNKGFTLIEVLVVISVLAMLTSMLVVYSRSSENQIKLITEQSKIIGVILRAKLLAFQAFKEETVPPCSFGVHFDSPNRKYLIFRETDRDAQNKCINNKRYGPGEELTGQIFTLPEGITFSKPTKNLDILFVPPEPKIYFDGSLAVGDEIIEINVDKHVAGIRVNSVGQVTTE